LFSSSCFNEAGRFYRFSMGPVKQSARTVLRRAPAEA